MKQSLFNCRGTEAFQFSETESFSDRCGTKPSFVFVEQSLSCIVEQCPFLIVVEQSHF